MGFSQVGAEGLLIGSYARDVIDDGGWIAAQPRRGWHNSGIRVSDWCLTLIYTAQQSRISDLVSWLLGVGKSYSLDESEGFFTCNQLELVNHCFGDFPGQVCLDWTIFGQILNFYKAEFRTTFTIQNLVSL